MTTNSAPRYAGRRRLSVAHLVAALVAMFVILPFIDRVAYGSFVESAVFTVVLLAAVSAVGSQRRTLITAALLVAPALLARWLSHFWPSLPAIDVSLLATIVFVAYVTVHLFRFVISARVVNAEVLCAAISIYLLFAVAWSFVYTLVARWAPGAFTFSAPVGAEPAMSGFTALYFSVQMLTSIAFGDILPATNATRMMAIVESTAGVFYLAILVARLVGVYSSQPPTDESRR